MLPKTLRIKDGFSGERSIVLPEVIRKKQLHDPLVSSLYITDIGYYPCAAHHFCERTSPISEHVLIYCANGKGYYRFRGKEYAVCSNQYFILPSGCVHAYWSDDAEPWTIYWVHFSGAHATFYIEDAVIPKEVRPGLTSRISYRNNIFEEMFLTLSDGFSQENLRYVSSLLHYYLGSMRFLQQYRKSAPDARVDSPTVIDAAIHYFSENIERRLELSGIADYLGYSVSRFSSIFKKETGESPLSYFNKMKIRHAQDLLVATDMKVRQISYKIGIDDPYYFSRLFTKVTGVSPKAYREQHVGNKKSSN